MDRLLWLAIAYIGGICAILGSLMLLGSFLLWLIPVAKRKQTDPAMLWQNRLKLTGLALLLTLTGLFLLILFPFPS